MLKVPTNKALIDSLKIRVRLDKVKILDKRLITDYIEYYPDLDHLDNDTANDNFFGDELKKATPYVQIINGITYRIYVKAFIDSDKQAIEYVVFQVSAKMLKEQYFEGISKTNYGRILKDINSFNVVRISEKAFLDGLVSDIDICINSYIPLKSLNLALGMLENFALPSKKPLLHRFNQANNVGLDFNKREKGTNSNPYLKIYHKGLELQNKSSKFFYTYLNGLNIERLNDLVRYEYTIKASKHKEYLKTTKKALKSPLKTFEDLVNIHHQELKKIALTGVPQYTKPKEITRIDKNSSPADRLIMFYMTELIKHGKFDREQLESIDHLFDHPVTKSRMKKKVRQLVDLITKEDSHEMRLDRNHYANQFLRDLNINF